MRKHLNSDCLYFPLKSICIAVRPHVSEQGFNWQYPSEGRRKCSFWVLVFSRDYTELGGIFVSFSKSECLQLCWINRRPRSSQPGQGKNYCFLCQGHSIPVTQFWGPFPLSQSQAPIAKLEGESECFYTYFICCFYSIDIGVLSNAKTMEKNLVWFLTLAKHTACSPQGKCF